MAKPTPVADRYRHVVIPEQVKHRPRVLNIAASSVSLVENSVNLSEENSEFLDWLFHAVGLDMSLYRTETLKRRLPACLRALHARSPGEARRLLEQNPALIPTALDAMLVGVTWLFRDPGVFETLNQVVLPALLEGRKNLHAWCAGCSEGAEVYSLAMLLSERGMLSTSYLLGTDCRGEAIRRARLGRFDAEAVKCVPPPLLERYFVRDGLGWEVVPRLRSALRWRTADVLQNPEPGVWDLILCRNTAMYLRGAAMTALFEKLETLLRPGGVLLLGKAERPQGRRLSFVAPCIYRRNRG